MASQAKQLFYVIDPYDKRWSITLKRKHISHSNENHYLNFNIIETPYFVTHVPTSYEEVYIDDVHVIRYYHEEGI